MHDEDPDKDDDPIGHFVHFNELVELEYFPAGHGEQGGPPVFV